MVKRTNHELFSGFSSINACVTDSDAVKKKKGQKKIVRELCWKQTIFQSFKVVVLKFNVLWSGPN